MQRKETEPLIQNPSRITLLMGAYGSGKSEISINFAKWLNRSGRRVTLCDLDMINPFFRSADARYRMESEGICLVAPVFAGSNVDVPAVPARINSIFDDKTRFFVLDIGGEDLGARVVATIKDRLALERPKPAVWLVVNPCRPFSHTAEQIIDEARLLTEASGLMPTGLVYNANLLDETTAELLVACWPQMKQASEKLLLPVVFAAAMDDVIPEDWNGRLPDGPPLLVMRREIYYLPP